MDVVVVVGSGARAPRRQDDGRAWGISDRCRADHVRRRVQVTMHAGDRRPAAAHVKDGMELVLVIE